MIDLLYLSDCLCVGDVALDFHDTCRFGGTSTWYWCPSVQGLPRPRLNHQSDMFFLINDINITCFCCCPVSKQVILQHAVQNVLFSLRPHLQRDSARAEESSPANLSRWRCAGGGDVLFGRFVGFEGILKRKAPFQNEFQYLCQKYVYICERHRCEWWILNIYESMIGCCSHLVFRTFEGWLAPIGASILHRRNFAQGSYMWRAVALCLL